MSFNVRFMKISGKIPLWLLDTPSEVVAMHLFSISDVKIEYQAVLYPTLQGIYIILVM